MPAKAEVTAAQGVPGVLGLMYTTWSNDYSQLQNFADAAQSAWGSYLSSIPAAKSVADQPPDPAPATDPR